MVRKKQPTSDTVNNPITQMEESVEAQMTLPNISMEATAAAAAAVLQASAFSIDAEAAGVSIVDPQTATELLLSSEITALADPSTNNINSELQESQHDISFAHPETLQSANPADYLDKRRRRDRQKYANMSNEERTEYNMKRRAQYHRQSDLSRKKRRERERR